MTELRRFIAGAICPACKQQDKLFVREEGALRICECVRCGHREALDREGNPVADAPDTVRIIDRAAK